MIITSEDDQHLKITAENPDDCFIVGYLQGLIMKLYGLMPALDYPRGITDKGFHWVVLPKDAIIKALEEKI